MPLPPWRLAMAAVAGTLMSSGLSAARSPHRSRRIEYGGGPLDARPVVSPALNDAGSSALLKELERDLYV